jgi:hypothetical protein
MTNVLEVVDKNGKTIHLSNEHWKHILSEHPEVAPFVQEFKNILKNPTKIVVAIYDDQFIISTSISKKENLLSNISRLS